MADKLEPQKVLEAIENCSVEDQQVILEYAHDTIKQLLSDSRPVMHGQWNCIDEDLNTWRCSSCYEDWILIDSSPKENNMNFCPRCGAKMDGDFPRTVTYCAETEHDIGFEEGQQSIIEAINEAPTVDAVEVVRCKYCTHFKAEHYNDDGFYFTQWCGLYKMQKNDDDFCSECVRKDGNNK